MRATRRAPNWIRAACLLSWVCAGVSACAGRNHASSPELAQGRAEANADSKARGCVDAGLVQSDAQAAPPASGATRLPGERSAISGAITRAMAPLLLFARSSGHDAAVAAADVLAALADAIETIPGRDPKVRQDVEEIRFEAKRLRRSDRLSYELPKWIEEGLAAAVDALDRIVPANDVSRFWIGVARQTHEGIDTKSGLPFQRAPVQDALRATTDAFIVVGRGLCACR